MRHFRCFSALPHTGGPVPGPDIRVLCCVLCVCVITNRGVGLCWSVWRSGQIYQMLEAQAPKLRFSGTVVIVAVLGDT